MTIIPAIISGGAGSRLWPLSREMHPKPFIELPDGSTLIGRTYSRAARLGGVRSAITVTNRELLFLTSDAYAEAAAPEVANTFLLEPFGRDTAAAVALATVHAAAENGPDAKLLILPSDHLIGDEAAFAAAVAKAEQIATGGRIVTFGIVPEGPETGYGYIEAEDGNVLRFVEKPDLERAKEYVASGRFLWNSGMFLFAAGTMLQAMEAHCPDVLAGATTAYEAARRSESDRRTAFEVDPEAFAATPAISFDYAVMEKAENVACVPVECGWSDIGSWAALADVYPADEQGNRSAGETVFQDVEGCFVQAQDRLVGLVGVSDLLVIDTADALLVAHKDKAQDVKHLFSCLKAQGHEAAKLHRTAHRPWGTYTVLEEGDRFKIKRIEVKPGARLSLQAHHHRSEHWVVVSGTAKVVNGEREILLSTNESTYIPCGHKHRLENPGILPLVLIEVQSGEYLGEDDIVRFDDVYGRA
ncbi:mannose-1-phosphate guanylyltransferase/mannose-6-phosphate isomerase [Chelativorans sp. AA-79]|uniref:mannose-1-phosphate guanylyltransferase/mannose-6-phosphate isomerase n=1 Tax=Chelativorans sp. AA-79 TaxID=3028735 RepID=UPI0023FA3565|nr:mannose-1-phosphate guanylyltransferase/mannose-6-phosphate isomerase [Chelativorans sp. AA-79]WEX08336.1 mannose-1-phosphate guanylyltransferase/mannose-6-phosphate isomerase [Chelativorans sp. AA-79]